VKLQHSEWIFFMISLMAVIDMRLNQSSLEKVSFFLLVSEWFVVA
jgi:hypothetical protein